MASNELEVLDPGAPVENHMKNTTGRALNRRNLMAGLGLAGAAAGAKLLSGVRSARRSGVVQAANTVAQPVPVYTQTDYLNFLLNIKYLQATFYANITQGTDIPGKYTINGTTYQPILGGGPVFNQFSKVTFTGANAAQITDMMNEIYYSELNQLIALQTLIGPVGAPPSVTPGTSPNNGGAGVAIIRPTMDLLGTGATSGSTTNTAFTITAAANASGGNTVYTGTGITTGPAINNGNGATGGIGTWVGVQFLIAGFLNPANNGTFTCVASTGTSLTLNNPTGVAQSGAAASATAQVSNLDPYGTCAAGCDVYLTALGGSIAGTNTPTSPKILAMARLFEDISVTACTGLVNYLTGSNLILVSQILAADALHAGAVRLAVILQNVATAGTVTDLLGNSYIYQYDAPLSIFQNIVQGDDVQPVDPGTAKGATAGTAAAAALAATGPQAAATSIFPVAGQTIQNPCLTPAASGGTQTCTPTQYQGFFNTASGPLAGVTPNTANVATLPGFAFKRTTSQVLSLLYAKTPNFPVWDQVPIAGTQAPTVILSGGFFPGSSGSPGFNGNINVL